MIVASRRIVIYCFLLYNLDSKGGEKPMRKRICFIMIVAVAMLGGCAKSKDKPLSETNTTIREQEMTKSTEDKITSITTEKESITETKTVKQTSTKEKATESSATTETKKESETTKKAEEVAASPKQSQETVQQPQTTTQQETSTTQSKRTQEQEKVTTKAEPPATEPATKKSKKEKSIYDYEFDVEAIKAEMIATGEGMGLKHVTSNNGTACTPDNSSWAMPVTATKNFQGKQLKQALQDYVSSMPDLVEMAGGKISSFTIFVEPIGDGSYTFYFLY